MNGDYEAIRAVVRKPVAVAFEGFMFVLPHAEAIVGLRIPIFQVAKSLPSAGSLENLPLSYK